MRTTRVLDLCREAEQSVTDCSEQGHAIRKLAHAIREITEGETKPEPQVALWDQIWNLIVFAYRHELEADDLTNRIMGLINRPPPKSDPPSPT